MERAHTQEMKLKRFMLWLFALATMTIIWKLMVIETGKFFRNIIFLCVIKRFFLNRSR